MGKNSCDLAIIGSGLTGMSAAIAAYSRNPDLTIKLFGIPFDSNTAKKGEIENIPGINKVIGVDYIQQLTDQIQSLNTEFSGKEINVETDQGEEDFNLDITNEIVQSISRDDTGFLIKTEDQAYNAISVVLSTGLPELKHTIKGEDNFVHKGVSHCAVCDGALYRGKKVVIIGYGNTVARGALFLRKYCRKVSILCPDNNLNCDLRFLKKLKSSQNVIIKTNVNLDSIEITGMQLVQGLKYVDEGELKEISVGGVFIELKDKPNLAILDDLNLELTNDSFIKTNDDNSTSIQGIFAAGTVKGEVDYAPVLMGDGYKTGVNAANYLQSFIN
jgi:thioredoxin reductase